MTAPVAGAAVVGGNGDDGRGDDSNGGSVDGGSVGQRRLRWQLWLWRSDDGGCDGGGEKTTIN